MICLAAKAPRISSSLIMTGCAQSLSIALGSPPCSMYFEARKNRGMRSPPPRGDDARQIPRPPKPPPPQSLAAPPPPNIPAHPQPLDATLKPGIRNREPLAVPHPRRGPGTPNGSAPPKALNYMTTKTKIAANRRNAKRSTGPKTPAGRTVCSLNSVRGGLYATTVILPTENKSQFDEIHAKYQALYQPHDAYQQKLVDLLTGAEWEMMRADALGAAIYRQYVGAPPAARKPSSPRNRSSPNSQPPLQNPRRARTRSNADGPPRRMERHDRQAKTTHHAGTQRGQLGAEKGDAARADHPSLPGKLVDEFPPTD